MSKDKGLYKKYEVKKLSNPEKHIDAIVLEFDDPISRRGLRRYASALRNNGFESLARDIIKKCNQYEVIANPGARESELEWD